MKEKYYDAAPYEYFIRGKQRRIIDPDTSELLENFLKMLEEKGEKETFKYIKNLKNY